MAGILRSDTTWDYYTRYKVKVLQSLVNDSRWNLRKSDIPHKAAVFILLLTPHEEIDSSSDLAFTARLKVPPAGTKTAKQTTNQPMMRCNAYHFLVQRI